MNAHEILIAAKAMCTPETWAQGRHACERGRICAVLAISRARPRNPSGQRAARAAERALQTVTRSHNVADWQDAPERTLAEVHAAFDRAIKATRP